jgi:hypothetical protein
VEQGSQEYFMFQRLTEKARKVIFFAPHEASRHGSPNLATEHVLLGWFREDRALTDRLLHEHRSIQDDAEGDRISDENQQEPTDQC